MAQKPLAALGAHALADHKRAKSDYEIAEGILDAQKGAVDKRMKAAASQGANLDSHAAELRRLIDEAPLPPVQRRYKTNDVAVM